jgi:hypothetical protein
MKLEVVVSYHSKEDNATIFLRDASQEFGSISMPIEGTSMSVSREFAMNLYIIFKKMDEKNAFPNEEAYINDWIEFVNSYKDLVDNTKKQ